jgi:hypothetical protein
MPSQNLAVLRLAGPRSPAGAPEHSPAAAGCKGTTLCSIMLRICRSILCWQLPRSFCLTKNAHRAGSATVARDLLQHTPAVCGCECAIHCAMPHSWPSGLRHLLTAHNLSPYLPVAVRPPVSAQGSPRGLAVHQSNQAATSCYPEQHRRQQWRHYGWPGKPGPGQMLQCLRSALAATTRSKCKAHAPSAAAKFSAPRGLQELVKALQFVTQLT